MHNLTMYRPLLMAMKRWGTSPRISQKNEDTEGPQPHPSNNQYLPVDDTLEH